MLRASPGNTQPQGTNPRSLLRLMILVASLSIAFIIAGATFGIQQVYTAHLISEAEGDAVDISELILVHLGQLILRADQGGKEELVIDANNRAELDRQLRTFLRPFDIVKIKIYDLEHKIVHCTDPALIGRVDEGNRRLENALAGNNDSKFETKDAVLDLAEEKKFDVDVVECYVPIRSAQGAILGSFELYLDVTRFRQEIGSGVRASIGILTLILLAVFAASFLVVRKGTRQLEEAQQALQRMATTDPLTGAYNRGEILSRAREEISRLQRACEKLAAPSMGLIMLDIDHFKKINDSYGHLAGDQVLRELTHRIKLTLRPYDIFGRYGGEEFLALLPGTTLDGSRGVAERLRQVVGQSPFTAEGQNLQVTISLGFATILPEEPDLTEALRRADEGLYQAKNSGRDRVCGAVPG
ncbi:GGDEF domain-containing protein [Desulfuromonas versatilis]|uniref:diguanylate cyclase n=1 Tax=Desulfuromonas versatilis TaxID=2802975 RepID=A0ABM8HSP4_9BACT|nr:GGDEF domain-containing protein [Desulfuromonas versatilis]BCR03481.1 GGDEF domain-containing protein [Desulfuromonas versatilis]